MKRASIALVFLMGIAGTSIANPVPSATPCNYSVTFVADRKLPRKGVDLVSISLNPINTAGNSSGHGSFPKLTHGAKVTIGNLCPGQYRFTVTGATFVERNGDQTELEFLISSGTIYVPGTAEVKVSF